MRARGAGVPQSSASWPSGPSSRASSTEAGRRAAAGTGRTPAVRRSGRATRGGHGSRRQLLALRAQFGEEGEHRDQLQQFRRPGLRPGGRADRPPACPARPGGSAPRTTPPAPAPRSTRTPTPPPAPGGDAALAQQQRLLVAVVGRLGRAGRQRGADVRAAAAREPGAFAVPAHQPQHAAAQRHTAPPGVRVAGERHGEPVRRGPGDGRRPGQDVDGGDLHTQPHGEVVGQARGQIGLGGALDHLHRALDVLVRGDRRAEVTGVRQAVGADRAEVGQPERRTVVLAHITAGGLVQQLHTEPHPTRITSCVPAPHAAARTPCAAAARRAPARSAARRRRR
ncbi:hypothetical protein SALBM217S_07434 [Streptomyces griseoloalbus]